MVRDMLSRSGTLGPQCAKCRRRRVKCDSTTPRCLRCHRDGIDCPGYATRTSNWNITTPSTIASSKKVKSVSSSASSRSRGSDVSSGAPTPASTSTEASSTELATTSYPNTDLISWEDWDRLTASMHRDLALSIDLQLHAFRDAMAYFEVCVRPFLVGCAIPNQPRPLNEAEWAQLPRIMQHALVYAVSSHRVSRGQAEGEMGKVVLRRLHEHRGRALALLRGHLGLLEEGEEEEDAGTWTQPKQGAIQLGGKAKWRAPGWSGLVLITMMLGNEVQLSAFGKQGWKWHFEAAWKCVDMLDGGLRGGPPGLGGERLAALEKSYKHGIEPELACTYLLQIEVLSATTTPIWKLERREGVREALGEGILEGLEDRILISSCPCPLSVLRALAEINDLRIGLYRRRYETVAIPDDLMGCGSEEVSKRLWDILTTLLCFDANAWANQVYERHYTKLPPSSDAPTPRDTWQHYWATAARCYHSAAVVYLVRAFQSNHLKSPLLRECAETTAVLLDEHRQTLSDGLKFLTEDSSAADPVERAPRLWRFISWPLFVDAYNAVSWPDVGGLVDLGKMRIDRLTTLGRHMGVNAMLDAVVVLEEVQFGRKHTWSWQWDDGFQDRCIFAL